MPLWIALTVAAAFLQNLRSTLQKQLTGQMSAIANWMIETFPVFSQIG